MDDDISHAVEERLAAIEARLDELEGNGTDTEEDGDEDSDDEEEEPAPVVAPTSRRGRKSQGTIVEEPIEDTATVSTEWSST